MNVSTPSIVPAATKAKRTTTTTFLNNYVAAFERAYPGVPITIRPGKGGYRVIIRGEWTQEDMPMTIDQIITATHDLTKGRPTIQ